MIKYKGCIIDYIPGYGPYSIQIDGDDILFETEEEAKAYIDEMENAEFVDEDLNEEIDLEETYSDKELDALVGRVFNQQKIQSWYRKEVYKAPRLYAKCVCVKCDREKDVFLSNLINDPEKYGSCVCSDTNVDAKIDYAQELYTGGRKLSSNTSGYTGISYVKNYGGEPYDKWRAYIDVDGKRTYLGDFKLKKDAIEARRAAAENGVAWYKENRNKILRAKRRSKKKIKNRAANKRKTTFGKRS